MDLFKINITIYLFRKCLYHNFYFWTVHADNYLNTIVSRRCQVPQFDNITAGMCNQTSVMEKMLSNHYLHKNTTVCYCDTDACMPGVLRYLVLFSKIFI